MIKAAIAPKVLALLKHTHLAKPSDTTLFRCVARPHESNHSACRVWMRGPDSSRTATEMDFDYNEQVRADTRTLFAKAKERDDEGPCITKQIDVFIATLEKFEDYFEQIDQLIALKTTIKNNKSKRGKRAAEDRKRFFDNI
ncbi:hypothetical protein F5883DRAFT_656255 [Diaporthe sp. PMI_573]|nr:hypothetical protein F5883DRAFT_656255 [Diaporthaceae sp. PMI_573]